MKYSLMEALFEGRVVPWDRRGKMTDEHRYIFDKTEEEKQYFIEKMSLDDRERFEALTDLYERAAFCEEVEIYSHGFTLGAFLAMELMEKKETIYDREKA